MKRMKRIGSLLLTLVFFLCLIPASVLPVWAYDVYGTVYASALPNGVDLDVYADTAENARTGNARPYTPPRAYRAQVWENGLKTHSRGVANAIWRSVQTIQGTSGGEWVENPFSGCG